VVFFNTRCWEARVDAVSVMLMAQFCRWYAKRFLHPDIVDPYEYIFIWDEDLDVEHFDAEKYVWSFCIYVNEFVFLA